jgi:hypothetical protein
MILVLAGLAFPAAAQDRGPELTVGYQYQEVPAGSLPFGFTVDASAPLGTVVDIVGQFDWSRTTTAEIVITSVQTVSTFAGGIRRSGRGSTFRPFLQLLAGVTRNSFHYTLAGPHYAPPLKDTGGTMATMQVGGGLAVSLNRRVSAVGELDYRPYIHSLGSWSHSLRAVGGVRINLK